MWFSSLWHVFSLSLMFSFVKNFYVQGISDVKSKESFTITHEGICCNICYAPWKAIVLRKWMVKKKGQIIIMENTKKCIQCASDTFNKKVCQWKAGSHIFFLKCVWISMTLMQHGDRSWTFSLMPLSPGWCLWKGATALEVELLMVVSHCKAWCIPAPYKIFFCTTSVTLPVNQPCNGIGEESRRLHESRPLFC